MPAYLPLLPPPLARRLSSEMQHPAMPAAAFLAVVIVCLPFAIQKALYSRQNFPSFALALWLLVANVICGVDALVWAQDAAVHIPVWCDISE